MFKRGISFKSFLKKDSVKANEVALPSDQRNSLQRSQEPKSDLEPRTSNNRIHKLANRESNIRMRAINSIENNNIDEVTFDVNNNLDINNQKSKKDQFYHKFRIVSNYQIKNDPNSKVRRGNKQLHPKNTEQRIEKHGYF